MCTSRAAKRAPSSSRCQRKLLASENLGATLRDEADSPAISILKRDTSTPAHPNAVFRPDPLLLQVGSRNISIFRMADVESFGKLLVREAEPLPTLRIFSGIFSNAVAPAFGPLILRTINVTPSPY